MILNLGCGNNKIPGAVNVDRYGKPDVCATILNLPFKDDSVDKIYLFHTIEHIQKTKHEELLKEIRRVLIETGELIISYPEFVKVAQNFIENKHGKRDFWEHTVYGLQRNPGDFHVSLMYTPWFVNFLKDLGFVEIRDFPEPTESFNTVVKCKKGKKLPDFIKRYRRDIFGIDDSITIGAENTN